MRLRDLYGVRTVGWTNEQHKFLLKNYNKLSYKDIGEGIGKTEALVSKYARYHGIKKVKHTTKDTICWDCKHAVPSNESDTGCNWSKEFKEVEGWTIEVTNVRQARNRGINSVKVISCPRFKKG